MESVSGRLHLNATISYLCRLIGSWSIVFGGYIYISFPQNIKRPNYFKYSVFKKYLLINNYLVPFKVTRSGIIHCQRFFQSSKRLKHVFLISPTAPVSIFLLFPQSQQNAFLSSVFLVLERGKSQRGQSGKYGGSGVITVLFLAKNSHTSIHTRTGALSRCSKILDFFSTILYVSYELLRTIRT